MELDIEKEFAELFGSPPFVFLSKYAYFGSHFVINLETKINILHLKLVMMMTVWWPCQQVQHQHQVGRFNTWFDFMTTFNSCFCQHDSFFQQRLANRLTLNTLHFLESHRRVPLPCVLHTITEVRHKRLVGLLQLKEMLQW